MSGKWEECIEVWVGLFLGRFVECVEGLMAYFGSVGKRVNQNVDCAVICLHLLCQFLQERQREEIVCLGAAICGSWKDLLVFGEFFVQKQSILNCPRISCLFLPAGKETELNERRDS